MACQERGHLISGNLVTDASVTGIYVRRGPASPDTEVLGANITGNVVVRCGGRGWGSITVNVDLNDSPGSYLSITNNVIDDHKTVFRAVVTVSGTVATWAEGDFFDDSWTGPRINGGVFASSTVTPKTVTHGSLPGQTSPCYLEVDVPTGGTDLFYGIYVRG